MSHPEPSDTFYISSVSTSMTSTKTTVPPDGGYGWAIVLAAFLQFSFGSQLMPLFDVLFGPKFDEIGATSTEIYSVYSTFVVFWHSVSIFVGPLADLRSERFVAVCAIILQTLGLVISVFSTSVLHLVIGFGIIWGCGMGLANTNNIIIINKYFQKRVGLALGIAIASVSIIGLVTPQALKILMENFVFEHVVLIYAGISLTSGLLGALLMHPVRNHSLVIEEEIEEDESLMTEEKNVDDKTETKCSFCQIFSLIKWSLLKDPYFLLIAVANSICFTAFVVQLPQISIISKELGFSLEETANLVSILSATDIIARFGQGLVGDLSCLAAAFNHPKKFLFSLSSIFLAVIMTIMAYTQTFLQMVVLVCLTSVCNAGIMLNSSQVYRECFSNHFPSALGIASFFRAFFALTIGPLAGFLKEHFQDFRASLFFLACASAFCVLVWTLVDFASNNKNKDQRTTKTSPS